MWLVTVNGPVTYHRIELTDRNRTPFSPVRWYPLKYGIYTVYILLSSVKCVPCQSMSGIYGREFWTCSKVVTDTGADPGFVHRGGGYFERSERRAKRVKNSWGSGGCCKPPGKFWNLEPLRVNLSVVWQIISYFLGYFFIKNIWENIFYDFIYTRSGDFLGFASQMKHFSSQIYWHNEGTITVQHTTFSKITTEYN